MTQYLFSAPNPGTEGKPKALRSDDVILVERWTKAEDRPGFAVYYCPNPLKPEATSHGKDSLAAIEQVFADIDFNRIVETPEQATEKLAVLLLESSELVDSGHGYHVKYQLKEAVAHDDPELKTCAHCKPR